MIRPVIDVVVGAWRLVLGTLAILLITTMSGCGGGTSQEDLMRAAMRTSGDEDEEDEEETATPPTKREVADKSGEADSNHATDKPDIGLASILPTQIPPVGPHDVTATDRAKNDDDGSDTVTQPTMDETTQVPADREPAKDVVERRRRSIENMSKISDGILAYVRVERTMPRTAIIGADGEPLLSWRVELLPYLGYRWLYDQFDLTEPWNSVNNLPLLKQCPEIFRDPQFGSVNTPYLLPMGSFTAFPGGKRQILAQRIEDGLDETVILVETDQDRAIPWSKPGDFTVVAANPYTDLGGLYDDGFFVAFGDGSISRIHPHVDNAKVRAIFTVDGGEAVSRLSISSPATPELASMPNHVSRVTSTDDNSTDTSDSDNSTVANRSLPDTGPNYARLMDEQSYLSLRESKLRSAFQQKHAASILFDPKIATRFYGWSAALERPVLGYRWGVGVNVSTRQFPKGPEPIGADSQLDRWQTGQPGEKELEFVTGELGLRVMKALRQGQDEGKFGTFISAGLTSVERVRRATDNDGPFQPVLYHPGIYIIGKGDERILRHVGSKYDVDLIVLFDLDLKYTRQRLVHNTTTVSIIDARTGKELWKSPGLNNIRVKLDRQDPLKDDPVSEMLTDLQTLIRDELTVGEFPQLTPADARARLELLPSETHENPLSALAEAHVYLGLGLISEYEYRQACVDITGDEEAAVLATGGAESKSKYLESLIDGESIE